MDGWISHGLLTQPEEKQGGGEMWWLVGILHHNPASSSPRVRIRYIQQTGRVHCIILSTSQGRLGNVPENIRYTAVHGRKCFILQNYLHFLSIILSLFSLSSLPFSTGTLCLPPLHTSSPSLHSLPSLPSLPLPPSFSSLHSLPFPLPYILPLPLTSTLPWTLSYV